MSALTSQFSRLKLVPQIDSDQVCNWGPTLSSPGGAVVAALQDISMTIHQGGRVALIGHNGAGKSSFLRLVSGVYLCTQATSSSCAGVPDDP